jgi:isopentenyl-diphosphate delta-isomerase
VTVEELVVLMDDDGQPCGTAPKRLVHHATTPLHLAFSCWIFDGEGRTLLTRRALAKQTWPGAWTNTVCGHPAPAESIDAAVRRRVRQELGMSLQSLDVVLPDFRYRAVMDDGTVENEICPVFAGISSDPPVPDPAEVGGVRWATLDEVRGLVDATPSAFSPWMILQLPLVPAPS